MSDSIKQETGIQKLDKTFNHMRSQLDFTCKSIDWQNKALKAKIENEMERSERLSNFALCFSMIALLIILFIHLAIKK